MSTRRPHPMVLHLQSAGQADSDGGQTHRPAPDGPLYVFSDDDLRRLATPTLSFIVDGQFIWQRFVVPRTDYRVGISSAD